MRIALGRTGKVASLSTLAIVAMLALGAAPRAPETIVANDNRRAAGMLANGVLTVKLEARMGMWRPEGPTGPALPVAAWAEVGKALSVPGPLIRVPVGTTVRVSLRNSLDTTLTVYGFGKVRGLTDSISIPVGSNRDVQFEATTAGTYYYMARRRILPPLNGRTEHDMELVGAIVIDPPGARANDRVFVLSWWFAVNPQSPTGVDRGTMTINGLSWPHTERIDLTQGDSVRWRVINMTEIDHPMHLHGFYFRVTSKGDGNRDTVYSRDDERLGVTEIMRQFSTMSLAWLPDRAGNWIYHCHFADHLSSISSLEPGHATHDEQMMKHQGDGMQHNMFGLVLGLRVAPKGPAPKVAESPRTVRMTVREKEHMFGANPGYAMVIDGTPEAKDPNAMPQPGAPLVLERGRPVAITVVNRAKESASIHWHGVELESYPDGVPGWSGSGSRILPSIKPGDSITVHYTPPRAGSFMYHSHFNESSQITSGVYGAIIVVEPGEAYNPERDRLFFFGTAGPITNVIFGPFPNYVMNGTDEPAPIELRAGQSYRFRMFNLAEGGAVAVSLASGGQTLTWTSLAKDGAALPPSQVKTKPAALVFEPGEIYDFEFTPQTAGDLALKFGPVPLPPGLPPLPPIFSPRPPTRAVTVHVK
jgi:FtsP/CotA-like multicopper oxidase with cupredoxin domain